MSYRAVKGREMEIPALCGAKSCVLVTRFLMGEKVLQWQQYNGAETALERRRSYDL